jgi:tRNA1(Val) A37 N6-methylase TrmN6
MVPVLARNLFSEIFSNQDGYEISKSAKEFHKQDKKVSDMLEKVLYGETLFSTVREIMFHDWIKKYTQNAKVFYDLGSGIGNVAIACSLLGLFEKINGIEFIQPLHAQAVENRRNFAKVSIGLVKKLNFVNDSFLNCNFTDADVIFANHPTKDKEVQAYLDSQFQLLKKDSIVIYDRENVEEVKILRGY